MHQPARRLAAAAIVATTLVTGNAHAAIRRNDIPFSTLTLRGDTTAYVDVDFRENVLPYQFHVRPKVGGSYAGFLAQRLNDGQVVTGEVWVPAFHNLFRDRAGTLDGGAGLGYGMVPIFGDLDWGAAKPAARYRFYLLADGPAEVVVEVAYASAARSLRPAHRRPALARVLDMGSSPGGERRVGFTATATTLAVTAAAWASREHGLHDVGSCIRKDEASCSYRYPTPSSPVEVPAVAFDTGYGFQEPETWHPGDLPTGPVNAVTRARGLGLDGHGLGFFLAVDLVR